MGFPLTGKQKANGRGRTMAARSVNSQILCFGFWLGFPESDRGTIKLISRQKKLEYGRRHTSQARGPLNQRQDLRETVASSKRLFPTSPTFQNLKEKLSYPGRSRGIERERDESCESPVRISPTIPGMPSGRDSPDSLLDLARGRSAPP